MKKIIFMLTVFIFVASSIFALIEITIEKIEVVPDTPNSQYTAQIWMNRSQGASYYAGEYITINFTVNKDSYVVVYDIAPGGEVTILFPNRFDQNNFVMANQVTMIPRAGYKLQIENKPGKEYLQIIASNKQFVIYESWKQEFVNSVYPPVSMKAEEYFKDFANKIIIVPDDDKPIWTSAITYFYVK